MLNQVVLVGRITKIETFEGKLILILATQRSYKNTDGIYETDFVPITLYNSVAEKVQEYCTKGDVMGIKGVIHCKEGNIEIIAERVTFLNSQNGGDN